MGFQQGLSGLNTSSKSLDTIGNNIANSGTIGFKSGSAQFADVFAASLNGAGAAPVGIGAKVAGIVQQFSQGNITVTNNPLDTAINGGGFFQMDDGSGGTFYARNGQFQLDKNGFIVSAQGSQLKGIPAVNGVIATGAPAQPLRLFDPTQSLSGTPQRTGGSPSATGVQANVNLDSRLGVPATGTFNSTDPTSYNQSTATTIYDSLGNPHTYSMYFVKGDSGATVIAAAAAIGAAASAAATGAGATVGQGAAASAAASAAAATGSSPAVIGAAASAAAIGAGATAAQALAASNAAIAATPPPPPNTWTVYTTVTNPAGASPTFTDLSVGGTVKTGTLTFNSSGTLTSAPFAISLTAAQMGYAGAITTPQAFPLDFSGSTQYGAAFAVNALIQDGYASGTLAGFNIGADGTVLGRYTNGQTKAVGQVVLASFRNPQGLQPLGDNRWSQSASSGDPIVGSPGSSGQYGVLQASALEDSNVDLTAELVSMITQQRAYQANAQTIKTQDSILQTLVNLR